MSVLLALFLQAQQHLLSYRTTLYGFQEFY